MITKELWESGLTFNEYIAQMDVYQKEMRQRINDVYITSAEFDRLKNLEKTTKLLVLTEAWCKDSLMNLPIIIKIAEASPKIELRIFDRSKFANLTSFFKDQGLENIPLCWIMNEDFSKRGYWIERPKKAYRMLEQWKNDHPEFQSIAGDTTLNKEEKKEKMAPYLEKLLDEMWNWYDTELQSETVREIYQQLQ